MPRHVPPAIEKHQILNQVVDLSSVFTVADRINSVPGFRTSAS